VVFGYFIFMNCSLGEHNTNTQILRSTPNLGFKRSESASL
jgi:hypothetical protein